MNPPLPGGQTTTFELHHGISTTPGSDGAWRAELVIDDRHRQPHGIVHGGVYAALAETVASVGTAMAVAADGMTCMGQSNHTSFLRAATDGTLVAVAVPIHRGRTTWVWEVDITNRDRRVARASVTMAVRPPR